MAVHFKSAIPKLASLNIEKSLAFFEKLGFTRIAVYPDCGIVRRDVIEIHFWLCDDPNIPKTTGCRLGIAGIDILFERYSLLGVIHPNDPLSMKPWGLQEFSILDIDGNLLTFFQVSA